MAHSIHKKTQWGKKMERTVFPGALNWPSCFLDSSHVQSCPALSWSHLHSLPPGRGLVDVLCCHGTAFPASFTEEIQSLPAIPGQTAQAIICLYILLNWQEEWKCLQPSSKWMNAKWRGFLITLEMTEDSQLLHFNFFFYWTEEQRDTYQQGACCWKRYHGHKWCHLCCEFCLTATG